MNKRIISVAVALLFIIIQLPVFAANITVNVSTDGFPGSTVSINGSSTYSVVSIKILKPDSSIFAIGQANCTQGSYYFSRTLPVNAEPGSYTVVVGYENDVTSTVFQVAPRTEPTSTPTPTTIPTSTPTPTPAPTSNENIESTPQTTPAPTQTPASRQESEKLQNINDLLKDSKTIEEGVKAAGEYFGKLSGEITGNANIEETLSKLSKAVSSLIEGAPTVEVGEKIVKELVASIGSHFINKELASSKVELIREEVLASAQKVVGKAGTIGINIKSEGNKKVAEIDGSILQDILKRAEEAKKTASSLNDVVQALDIKLDSKVIIKVSGETGKDGFQLKIPAELLKELQGQTDKLEVSSDSLSISLAPDAIPGIGNGKSIEFFMSINENSASVKAEIEVDAFIDSTLITNFNKPVHIAAEIKLDKDDNPDNMTVLYEKADNTYENMKAHIGRDGKVTFHTDHFSTYRVITNNVTFSDVAKTRWSAPYIESMAAKGIISGMGEGKYQPSAPITRAQFTKMIVETLGMASGTKSSISFSDVGESDWFISYVNSAVQAGIISGYDDKSFKPNKEITRQEMMVLLARALEYIGVAVDDAALRIKSDNFSDYSKVASWAEGSVAACISLGYINGKEGNIIDPEGTATREEAAKIVYMLFNL